MTLIAAEPEIPATVQPPRRAGWLLALWILSGAILLMGLNSAPAQRTQEARVLETAREMLGAPARDWIVPKLNGEVRLRKPPLAYYLTAASYKIFGVSAWAGRMPAAIAGWLTVGVTYSCASWLFGRTAGVFAGTALLSSFLFFRHMRFAETDAYATFFVTLAIWATWRAAQPRLGTDPLTDASSRSSTFWWWHLSAAATGLAAMSKGGPIVFPLLFLLALAASVHSWRILTGWLCSGAPLTLAIVALPWTIYAFASPSHGQIIEEFRVLLRGENHSKPFYIYFPQILVATAPWTGFVILALIEAAGLAADNRRLRGVLVWIFAILMPLLFVGNKQQHYLLPLIPPLMILVGWVLERAWRSGGSSEPAKRVRWVFYGTSLVILAAGVALPVAEQAKSHSVRAIDLVVGIVIAIGAIVLLAIDWLRGSAMGVVAFATACVIAIPLLVGGWMPARFDRDPTVEARIILNRFGDKPYFFYGGNESLPLGFAMRKTIPTLDTPQEANALIPREPEAVLIVIEKEDRPAQRPPPDFGELLTIEDKPEKRTLRLFQYSPGPHLAL